MGLNNFRGYAFTLAEVLITLMIIGVVASLTIPVVTRKIQDAQYKVAWKKAYSVIAQATDRIMAERDSMEGLCSAGDHTCFRDAYLNYFTNIKKCETGANVGNCWPSVTKQLNGVTIATLDFAGAILNDGTQLRFYMGDRECEFTSESGIPICGKIFVNVNGMQGPNVSGRDVFSVYIVKDGIIPTGTPGDTWSSANCTTHGFGCSALYLYQ